MAQAVLASDTLYFRYAQPADAERILELRRAPAAAGVLSATSDDAGAQRNWLESYLHRHASGAEHYFMICSPDLGAIGTVRVHDVGSSSCWWGSWIVAPASPVSAVLGSYLLVNHFIFESLRLAEARFQVRAGNAPVRRFHDAMKSQRIAADEIEITYRVDAAWYAGLRRRFDANFTGIRRQP